METDTYSDRNDFSEEENDKSRLPKFDQIKINTFSETQPI